MSFAFTHPKIRDAVEFQSDAERLVYRDNEFELSFDDLEQKQRFAKVFAVLKEGAEKSDLLDIGQEIGLRETDIDSILSDLDECRLIHEAAHQPGRSDGMSGLQLAFHLEDRYFNHWKPANGETELTALLLDGDPGRDVIVGWSFEYYNVTKMAHDAIIALVPGSLGAIKRQAIEFFNEEYRHDRLMLRALEALGFTAEQIDAAIPLPATQCLINMLSHWAKTDPLSYMASLFIYEGETADYAPYTDALREHGMPDDFVRGQEVHNSINVDGGHGDESREFLGLIDFVSAGDVRRVEANLQQLLRVEALVHAQILDYYRAPTIGIPRVLQ